jgi:hypothetical protein
MLVSAGLRIRDMCLKVDCTDFLSRKASEGGQRAGGLRQLERVLASFSASFCGSGSQMLGLGMRQ